MIPSSESEARETIARRLRRQATACSRLGSPLYADLLERAAQDVEAGGPSWRVLRGHEADPPGSAPALRLMGAVHRLVLDGHAPELARYYPSEGGDPEAPGVWHTFVDVLERNAESIQFLLERPVQTNEVRRSRVLLGGFLQIARETGLPLSLLEVGASAGLNLRWDHFRYEIGGQKWGDRASPVCLRDGFESAYPSLDVPVEVVARRGCDTRPIDPLTPAGRLTLLSYSGRTRLSESHAWTRPSRWRHACRHALIAPTRESGSRRACETTCRATPGLSTTPSCCSTSVTRGATDCAGRFRRPASG